jgi:signal transduction histidine kinase/ligand-binding sensor domain-containing protein
MNRAYRYSVPESASCSVQGHIQWLLNPSPLRVLVLITLFSACVSNAIAQYRSTHWTADTGLPQNIIRGITQTPDGYLWVATLNGIARFDGIRFTTFDKSNTPGISTNRFALMMPGPQGDLWLVTEDRTVVRYHRGQFSTLGASEGVPTNSVSGLTNDSHGNIWISCDRRIFKWSEDRGRFEPIEDDAAGYQSLSWIGTGFWKIQGDKLYCFVRGALFVHKLPKSLSPEDIRKVAVGSDGVIWFDLPKERFARLTGDKLEILSKPITTPFQGRGRESWKAAIGLHLDRTLFFPGEEGETGIRYNRLIEDDEHNVWVGSEGQGLYRIQAQAIHVYSVAQGLAGPNVYPILHGHDGDMWIGTWPAGLSQFHQGMIKTYTTKDGLPGLVSSLAEDDNGDLWIGTHNGVAVLSRGHIHLPEGLPRDLPVVQAILKTHDGAFLFGTLAGLYRYKDHSGSWVNSSKDNPIGDVRVLIEDRDGDVWFGGFGGLTKMHNGALTHWGEKDGLPSNNVRSIYQDADGVLWIGTYDGGLARYSNGQWTHYNQKDGLFDNGVFQILEDSHGNLWMSSNRGIFRVSKRQLNDVAAGRQRNLITVSYGRSDGMLNSECNGGLWPAGAKADDGKLWFPTQEGAVVIDPDSITVNQRPPRVVIESISLDHIATDLKKPIAIKRGQGGLEIEYTALSFSRPEQVAFRYTMDGLDTAWEDVGYRRTAYFSHLPPGTYIFKVMAANSDGVWSAPQSSQSITVLPPFYLTRSFIAVMSMLTLILIYILWSHRVRQLKREQASQHAFSQQLIASQESERRRISGELHDSLGQRLIIIKNHALFLLRPKAGVQTEEERRQSLEEIDSEASLAIDETRTISYNLRPFQLDRLGLTKAIEALVRSASRATGIQFSSKIEDIDEVFPEDLRINFYRIVQEGINNVVKHSGASEAEVHVEQMNRRIVLSIRDNGIGFPSEPRNVVIGKGGFGMTGIRERTALLGGTIKVQSHPSTGTLLRIEFDAAKRP